MIHKSAGSDSGNTVHIWKSDGPLGGSVTFGSMGRDTTVLATYRPVHGRGVTRRFPSLSDAEAWAEAVLTADPLTIWNVAFHWQPQ